MDASWLTRWQTRLRNRPAERQAERVAERATERTAKKETPPVMPIVSKSGTIQKSIQNNTPDELVIIGPDCRQIILAPLEVRPFKPADIEGFDWDEAELAGKIKTRDETPIEVVERMGSVFGIGFWLVVACLIVGSMDKPDWSLWGMSWKVSVWLAGSLLIASVVAFILIKVNKAFGLIWRFLLQMFSLLGILAIGLGLPAATVYYFGEGKALLAGPSPMLFARILQVAFIATASLLPVLLFFLFDRYQLNTLRNRLYRDLFRLDRGLETRSEIDAKYGSQIHEAYGSEEEGSGRQARGTRWPVLLCAFVLTMGWIVALNPIGPITAELAVRPLLPERSILTFGFLGAYFFGLQLIARRYARGDLKPKAYGYITIRILIVAILCWVLELIPNTYNITLVSAFLIGILPDELFTFLKEKYRGRSIIVKVPDAEKHPMTKLEGIDLYDRARLEQEGIVNVESFAHHDLIHLVLETRIPVSQLVDWMDQAILYLHTTAETCENEEANVELPKDKKVAKKSKQSSRPTAREILRYYGIRTATDFLACWNAAEKRDRPDDDSTEKRKSSDLGPVKEPGHSHLDAFRKLLGGANEPYRLEVIRDSLLDDEWIRNVEFWRDDRERPPQYINAGPKSVEAILDWAKKLMDDIRIREAIRKFISEIAIRDDAEARIRLALLFAKVPKPSPEDVKWYRENAQLAFDLGQDKNDILHQLINIHVEKAGDIDDKLRACDIAIALFGAAEDDTEKSTALEGLKNRRIELEQEKAISHQATPPDPAGKSDAKGQD